MRELGLALAAALAGCGRPAAASCVEVGSSRVCWNEAGVAASVEPSMRPARSPASPLGFRCEGAGDARRCIERDRRATPFACDGERCTQARPRLPDDGEWTCADAAGAVVCVGGEPAAGVASRGVERGWFCGERRGTRERVCVDLSPDVPDGDLAGWRCRFEHEPRVVRRCERDRSVHVLDDACDGERPCVDGAHCVASRCVPDRPAPSCWLDADCGGGSACRFGSCSAERR